MTIIDHPSPNHSPRKPGVRVDTVVIHHTGSDFDRPTMEWLCSPISKASAHYLIGTKGAVIRLVSEHLRAWHAGVSWLPWEKPTKTGSVNDRSIGIELVNPGDGVTPFTEAQYRALSELLPDVVRRLGAKPHEVHTLPGPIGIDRLRDVRPPPPFVWVLGHRDVAPGRKTDPADNFDWGRVREMLQGRTA